TFLGEAIADDAGHVWAVVMLMHSQPYPRLDFIRETTSVFASRLGLELERMRAADELRKTQEQLTLAQEAASMGLWTWELDSDLVFLSEISTDLLGLSPADSPLPRADLLHYLDPHERVALARNIDEVLSDDAQKDRYHREHKMTRPDGQVAWLSVYGVVVRDMAGRPVRLSGFLLDVTEQKQAELELVEREATLRSILSAAPTGISMVIDRGFRWVNGHLCDLVGRSRSELMARDLRLLFVSQAEYDRVMFEERRQIESRGISRVETRFLHIDGTELDIMLSSMPIDAHHLDRGFICVAQDVTELRRTERRAAQTHERFRAIFECANAGIVMVDRDGKVLQANHAYQRMIGFEPGEVIGMNVIEFTHPDDIELTREHLMRVAVEGGPPSNYEKTYLRPDGTELPVSVTSSSVRDDSGNVEGAMAVVIDITAQRETQSALELAMEELQVLKDHLEEENIYLKEEITDSRGSDEIIGEDPALQVVLTRVHQVARTNATVLITGETGTGKELVARAIHRQSKRRKAPMIRVNCASIPRDLFESEFFGHVRGSFTGAVADRTGRFQLADGGTLLLDEVGEIPLELQSKLLRVLQEGEYERIGEEHTRRADVRVIAATNRDIEAEVREGRFREDLFYRLSVFPIEVPPLRERLSDVPALAQRFLEQSCRRIGVPERELTEDILRRLQAYDWPGNVRELQNVIERAIIASPADRLIIPQLGADGEERLPAPGRSTLRLKHHETVVSEEDMRQIEKQNIVTALRHTDWRVAGADGAAELLGIHPSTLYSRIKALGIERPSEGKSSRAGKGRSDG
ncbi:PAS domain S-box protein, partial [candidate division GN15 bacterium]|nr:PAS domain S-box protein [candidate division GN15 bacterium]